MPSPQLDDPFVHAIAVVVGVARRHRFRVALIGGWALSLHGVQRTTADVDFLAEEAGAEPLHETLTESGARCERHAGGLVRYAATLGMAPLDILYARAEPERGMLERALPRLIRGPRVRVPVVEAEALIALKLRVVPPSAVERARDEADIRALLQRRAASLDLDEVRAHFRQAQREAELDRLLAERQEPRA